MSTVLKITLKPLTSKDSLPSCTHNARYSNRLDRYQKILEECRTSREKTSDDDISFCDMERRFKSFQKRLLEGYESRMRIRKDHFENEMHHALKLQRESFMRSFKVYTHLEKKERIFLSSYSPVYLLLLLLQYKHTHTITTTTQKQTTTSALSTELRQQNVSRAKKINSMMLKTTKHKGGGGGNTVENLFESPSKRLIAFAKTGSNVEVSFLNKKKSI